MNYTEIKAVIFDKDGTLLDCDAFWLPIGITATKKVLQNLECEYIPYEKVMAAIGVEDDNTSITGTLCSGTYSDIAEKTYTVLKEYGCRHDLEIIKKITVDAYHSSTCVGEIIPTCDDIVELMKWLKSRGIKIILVTSDDCTVTEQCLRELKIAEYFDVVYTDDGTHPNKPDPFCINEICKKFGVEKSQIVMVGDTVTDMKFAKNGGIKAVGVAKAENNRNILLKETDTVLPDISYLIEVI